MRVPFVIEFFRNDGIYSNDNLYGIHRHRNLK